MKKLILCIVSCLISSDCSASEDSNAAWSLVIPGPSNSCMGNGKGFEIKADFSGSGKIEIARLEINKKTHHERVAIWMNGVTL